MTEQLDDEPTKHGYPSADRWGRLGTGLLCTVIVLGNIWVVITHDDFRTGVALLSFLVAPMAWFTWIMLRGAIERRASLMLDNAGISIIGADEASRRILWPEVCALHHVNLTVDHHLRMRVSGRRKPIRIYYSIEDAAAILEQCARKANAAEDAYSLPFTAKRPNLLRAMLLPLSMAIPSFAVGVPALMDGVVGPIIVFSLIGGGILAGFYLRHARSPLKLSVSETGIMLVRKADEDEYVRWDDVTDLRLSIQEKWRFRPSLLMEWSGGSPLELNVPWVDSVRLIRLMKKTKSPFE